jgi:hypothetical protein
MTNLSKMLVSLSAVLLLFSVASAATIYVDAAATGAGDGTSWDNAYNFLQDALAVALSGDEIWVAQGVYKPDADASEPNGTGDRTATFQLINGVSIRGGFAGVQRLNTCCLQDDPNEQKIDIYCCCEECDCDVCCCRGELDSRVNGNGCSKCAFTTILCGDIGIQVEPNDNSYHVVTGSGTDETAVLENVTVKYGNADGINPDNNGGGMLNIAGSPTVIYTCFIENQALDAGGGMYNFCDSSPIVTSDSFCWNKARFGGGMANFARSNPILSNCVFKENNAMISGGGVNCDVLSDVMMLHNTFYGNIAGLFGGGLYCNGSDPTVYNTIMWANIARNGPQIAIVANNRRTHIGYCDLQGGKFAIHLDNATVVWDGPIMNLDPMFVDSANCNLRLRTTSPCLDASNNFLVKAGIILDRDATDRFVEIPAAVPPEGFAVGIPPYADLGAYERPSIIYVCGIEPICGPCGQGDPCPTPCCDCNAPQGCCWAMAYTYLQDAIAAAKPGDQIWVAKGAYTPDMWTAFPNRRYHPEETFTLKNDVEILGSFSGCETDITDRDCLNPENETILSGDLFGNDNYASPFDSTFFENTWNVVTATPNIDATSVLDGFTIKGGYANGTTPYNQGGGMLNLGSPTLICLLFQYNWAYDRGGALFNMNGESLILCCDFDNNFTRKEGAGVCDVNTSPTFIDCTFTNNTGQKQGGGMFNICSDVTIVDCAFIGNGSSHENGGGMANVNSMLTICDSTFVENSADQQGGGIASLTSAIRMAQCKFVANTAQDDGGGMYNMACYEVILVNCAFTDNTALNSFGGGIFNAWCTSPRIINCTFTRNAADEGGALYNGFTGPIFIDNTIMWADTAPDGPEISLEDCQAFITNCIIDGGEPGMFVYGTVAIHVTNLSAADPMFADADGRLLHASTALNSGDANVVPDCVTVDLDGNPRVVGAGIDLGAYESPFNCCTTCVGDLDGDGWVSINDYSLIATKLIAHAPDYYYQNDGTDDCADLDGDGWITISDYSALTSALIANAPDYFYKCE